MIVTTIGRRDHAFKKRILTQALSPSTIDIMKESILVNTRKLCRHLLNEKPSNGWNDAKNMSEWTAYVTSDIMGEIAFSRSWNIIESKANRHVLKVISQGVAGLNLVSENTVI